MIKNKKTTQTKRIVTKDKKERFKEIVADNKEFSSLINKFIEAEPSNQVENKQSASKIEDKKNNNN